MLLPQFFHKGSKWEFAPFSMLQNRNTEKIKYSFRQFVLQTQLEYDKLSIKSFGKRKWWAIEKNGTLLAIHCQGISEERVGLRVEKLPVPECYQYEVVYYFNEDGSIKERVALGKLYRNDKENGLSTTEKLEWHKKMLIGLVLPLSGMVKDDVTLDLYGEKNKWQEKYRK